VRSSFPTKRALATAGSSYSIGRAASGLRAPAQSSKRSASSCLEDCHLRTWIAAALAGSLIASVSAANAAAQPAPDRRVHSVQCLLAMAAANGAAQDPKAAAAARLGMVFFAAQLFGIDPGIDLAAAARTQLPSLNKQRLQALIPACGAELNRREQQIAGMGAQLKSGK
jgi:hypothetical protein